MLPVLVLILLHMEKHLCDIVAETRGRCTKAKTLLDTYIERAYSTQLHHNVQPGCMMHYNAVDTDIGWRVSSSAMNHSTNILVMLYGMKM